MTYLDLLRPLARATLEDMEREKHHGWRAPDEDLALLGGLVAARRPAAMLELGTCTGFSAILFGDILARCGGRLTTVEPDGNFVTIARHYAGRAGLDNVDFVEGKDTDDELLHTLSGREWDVIFIDTTHQYAQTVEELRLYSELASGHTTLLLHDASAHAAQELDMDNQGGVKRAVDEFLSDRPQWQGYTFERPAWNSLYGVAVLSQAVTR